MRRFLFVIFSVWSCAAQAQDRKQLPAISVTATSARQAFTNGQGSSLYVLNEGPAEVFVKLGNSSVVATANDIPVPPGCGFPFDIDSNASLAAITASGVATVRLTQGGAVQNSSCFGPVAPAPPPWF